MTGYERYKKIRKTTPPTGSVIESRRKKQNRERDKEFKRDIQKYK
jgi:hypothetical protein